MADQNIIEVVGGVKEMASDGSGAYVIDVSDTMSSITGLPVVQRMVDEDIPGTDLQGALMSGAVTTSGTNVTLPLISGLTARTLYRVYTTVNDGTQDFTYLLRIWCPAHKATQDLLTVPMVLDSLDSGLPGSAIQLLIDDIDAEIVRVAGAHTFSGTVSHMATGGHSALFLPRPAASITSVSEVVGSDTTALASDDYRSWEGGRFLERLNDGTNQRDLWGERITVVFTPVSDDGQRRLVALNCIKLAQQYSGLKEEQIGPYKVINLDYVKERNGLISSLVPAYGGGGLFV